MHVCEKDISNISLERTTNEMQEQLKKNMKLYLKTKFNEITLHFKYNQELYIRKYKELGGGDDFENIEINEIENENQNDNYLFKTEKENHLKRRDTELGNLLNSMNNLASTFSDLKNLVLEQGTILDRIDYNIDVAAMYTAKGKKHLMKASEMQKKSCFRNAMLFLIIFIFVEGLLLMFKFL